MLCKESKSLAAHQSPTALTSCGWGQFHPQTPPVSHSNTHSCANAAQMAQMAAHHCYCYYCHQHQCSTLARQMCQSDRERHQQSSGSDCSRQMKSLHPCLQHTPSSALTVLHRHHRPQAQEETCWVQHWPHTQAQEIQLYRCSVCCWEHSNPALGMLSSCVDTRLCCNPLHHSQDSTCNRPVLCIHHCDRM